MDRQQFAILFVQIPIALSASAGGTTLILFSLLNALGMPTWPDSYQNLAWVLAIAVVGIVSWVVVGKVLDKEVKS
ncbi:MAG: hypothetical protein HC936_03655 [Leptolyngbyaceae cyanobacterium SU_3_3]|nr:hypothetical protein [Leptolyngbyaceae cyanobacterium SU_3_3]NJR54621.1 hypothetical protein [Acaryochloris sp. CRU_2_0]